MSKIIHATFGKNPSSSSIDRRPHTFFLNTQRISNPNGGWEPVGFDEHGHYVILSRKTGQLVTLCPRSLDGNTLRAVVGSEYCDKHYGEHDSNVEKSVFNPSLLAADIRKECDELGRFDPTQTRGPGFYCEAGTLLVHFGNEVYQSSGGPIDTTPDEAVYVSGPGLGFSFDTPVFNPPAGVMVAGIALPTFDDAATTRTVRIQMQMLPAEERRASNPLLDSSNRDAVEELGARIRRLLISRWEILVAVQKAVRGMLFDLGHEARAADLYSPLVAGYIALTSAELPSQQRLEAILEECQLTKVEVKATQRDSDVCLSLLLNRRVVIFESDGEKQSRTPQRIRDVIWRIMDENLDIGMRQALIRQLEKFGLRPLWKPAPSEWKLVVATSEMNTGLRRLLQGTPWSLGGLKDVLLRLPGASIGQQRVDGMSQKVVELCLSKELVKPDVNGDYELPDAA